MYIGNYLLPRFWKNPKTTHLALLSLLWLITCGVFMIEFSSTILAGFISQDKNQINSIPDLLNARVTVVARDKTLLLTLLSVGSFSYVYIMIINDVHPYTYAFGH